MQICLVCHIFHSVVLFHSVILFHLLYKVEGEEEPKQNVVILFLYTQHLLLSLLSEALYLNVSAGILFS